MRKLLIIKNKKRRGGGVLNVWEESEDTVQEHPPSMFGKKKIGEISY